MGEPIQYTEDDIEKKRKIAMVKGEEDLFFFLSDICEFGKNPDPDGPRITEDQRELCQFLQAFYNENYSFLWDAYLRGLDEKERTSAELDSEKVKKQFTQWLALILTPRDTLKSTVIQGFVLWLLVKKPDVRILLYGEVHEQAQKRLAVIKRVIQSCVKFRWIYGNLDGSKAGLPWNENLFVSAKRKSTNIREASVETAGLDVTVNSRHYDWIFPDDVHSEKNTKSRDMIDDVKEKIELLDPLRSKNGKMIVTGVFWNDADVHTRLKEEHHPYLFHRSAYLGDGAARYTHALPLPTLKNKQKFMRSDLFACHYLMNPVSKENQSFKRDFFAIVPKETFKIVRTYICIDPAGDPTSEVANKKDSDFTGMVAWGVNDIQDMILLDGYRDKVSPTEGIEYAMQLIMKYKPFIVGIERAAVGNMRFYLQEELRKRGMYAILEDLQPMGRSKLQRILDLEPYARRRKMYIADDCPIKDDFLDEITRVTPHGIKSKFDDLVDPSAYMLDLFKKYGMPQQQNDEDSVPMEYLELNQQSRDFWMAVRKRERAVPCATGEFFAA